MINERLTKLEAKRLVKEFKKSHEKGEFRNKLGRIWWPIWNRIVVPVVAGSCIITGIATGGVATIAAGALLWAATHPFTKGFSVNVQNIAIKNAGLFGHKMKTQNIPEEVRKQAILEYLNQSGSFFYNRSYVKNHPEDINRMANGLAGSNINNLVAFIEYNLNRRGNYNQKHQKTISFKERLALYSQSYTAYKAQRQVDKNMLARLNRRDPR